ncbi:MAG: c-type cytochrome [Gammaproteobacteria bacterium]|nr:c-type cytochrome [Gammaproteobacteria bacterium]
MHCIKHIAAIAAVGLTMSGGWGSAHAGSMIGAGALDKATLGELLYFDQNLSINRNQACASCHTPPHFVDPANVANPANSPVSLGSDRTLNGGRNAPSAAYAAFSPLFHWNATDGLYIGGQFWDGRAGTLAEQAKGPFLNPVEMAMPSKGAVLKRIAERANSNFDRYRKLFYSVYGVKTDQLRDPESDVETNALYDMVADAISAFEKTGKFNQFSSKFDYVLAGKAAFTPSEANGQAIFNGKAGCIACHTSTSGTAPDGSVMPPMFTDFTYDNIGIPKSMNPLIAGNAIDQGLGGRADIVARDPSGSQIGKFKVMSLRNIAVTAPYGHNGFFATLEDIVHFYNTRDVASERWPAPEVTQNVNTEELGNLGLSAQEEADVVAFLRTLTDGYGAPLNQFAFPPFP